ncbi:MAG: hypothetical protein J6C98_09030 [Oscillospiraceae bacterium]|nr:hypothetical protein [Oscillospiraceae bacterium]
MKKRKWLHLALIVVCLMLFAGYRAMGTLAADKTAPEISMDGQLLQVSVQDPRTALLQGVTAKDKNDGDVTSSLVVERVALKNSDGTANVTYAAFDKAGNVTKAQREVKYTDYESPRFTLTAPLAFPQNTGFDVLSIVHAQDVVDGDVTHRVRASSLDDTVITALGVHSIEFRVTNSLGETVELVLPLEVYLAGSFQAGLALSDYLVYLPVGSSFNAQSYLKTFTLGTESVALNNGLPANYALRTSGEVNTSTPGVYSVDYRVTYTRVNQTNPDLNQTYTGYSKLIVVVEG